VPTHFTSFLLNLQDFQIDRIDKEKLLVGPWTSELVLTFDSEWLQVVSSHFK